MTMSSRDAGASDAVAKTVGQVACDGYHGTHTVWGILLATNRELWERSAAAVLERAALSPPAVPVPEEVRRLSEAATPGPFSVSGVRRRYNEASCVIVDAPSCSGLFALATADGTAVLQSLSDAKFFATAANYVRDVIAAHPSLSEQRADDRREIEQLEHELDVAKQERDAAFDIAHAATRSADTKTAWVVANAHEGAGQRFRCWRHIGPEWTADRNAALWFARRSDAEAFAAEDEDAWRILPVLAHTSRTLLAAPPAGQRNAAPTDWRDMEQAPVGDVNTVLLSAAPPARRVDDGGDLFEAGRRLIVRWGDAPELPEEMETALSAFEEVWLHLMAQQAGKSAADPVRPAPAADSGRAVEALRGISDDYMTSERHHPDYVLIPAAKFDRLRAAEAALDAPSVSAAPDDWRDDPSADDRWNAGLDYGMTQLCAVLGVDPASVNWDAATETLDGDVRSVQRGILAKWAGDDWQDAPRLVAPASTAPAADSGRVVPDQRSAWARAAETVGADKPWWWDKPWADLGYGSRGDVQAWFQSRDPLRRVVEPDGPDLYVRLHCDPRPHMLDAAPAPAGATEDGWRFDVEAAPRDGTSVLVAVPSIAAPFVGEAYIDSENGGHWWWAGTNYGDYHAAPLRETGHMPYAWHPMLEAPAPPAEGA